MSAEYSLLPLPVVIKMVSAVEDLRLTLYHSVESLTLQGKPTADYLLSIVRQTDNYARYLIFIAPQVTLNTISSFGDNLVQVVGVNYASDGSLLQSYVMPNVLKVPLTILRAQVQLYWRSVYYTFTYQVPQVDRMREIKQSLINIFVFPSITLVLYGKLVVHFTFVEQFFTPTYFGILNQEESVVESLTEWDWSDGLLVGTIDGQCSYLWNNQFFAICNQFPDLVFSANQRVVIGGNRNYYFQSRRPLTSDSIIVRSSYSHQLAMQANEQVGDLVDFVTLREYILIDNTNKYIIAFSNVLSRSIYDSNALLGSANFLNTDSTLATDPCAVVFVYTKTPKYQQYGSNFFFLYDPTNNVLYVYKPTFDTFLSEESGRITLSDLRTVKTTTDRNSFYASSNTEFDYHNAPSATMFDSATNASGRGYNADIPMNRSIGYHEHSRCCRTGGSVMAVNKNHIYDARGLHTLPFNFRERGWAMLAEQNRAGNSNNSPPSSPLFKCHGLPYLHPPSKPSTTAIP